MFSYGILFIFQTQNKDPFADIANLATGLNINFNPNTLGTSNGKSSANTPMGTSPLTTQFSSPTHNVGNTGMRMPTQPNTAAPTSNNMGGMAGNNQFSQTKPQQTHSQTTNSTGQATSQPNNNRPDYSRTHFETAKPTNAGSQSKSSDIFADILGEQGFKFGGKTQQGPRSINEMRKEDLIKDMDPNKVKILEWVSRNYV